MASSPSHFALALHSELGACQPPMGHVASQPTPTNSTNSPDALEGPAPARAPIDSAHRNQPGAHSDSVDRTHTPARHYSTSASESESSPESSDCETDTEGDENECGGASNGAPLSAPAPHTDTQEDTTRAVGGTDAGDQQQALAETADSSAPSSNVDSRGLTEAIKCLIPAFLQKHKQERAQVEHGGNKLETKEDKRRRKEEKRRTKEEKKRAKQQHEKKEGQEHRTEADRIGRIENEPQAQPALHQTESDRTLKDLRLASVNASYPIGRFRKLGYCVIINERVFDDPTLPNRGDATDQDAANLADRFQALGFRVRCHNNVDLRELNQIVQKYTRERDAVHAMSDLFVCCIMTHGDQKGLYLRGYDRYWQSGERVPVERLLECFDSQQCPALKHKPKLFFIQACRGEKYDAGSRLVSDGPSDDSKSCPYISRMDRDMLVLYSTVPGYYSFRESEGSWLMTTLVAVLDAHLRPASNASPSTACLEGRAGTAAPAPAFPRVSPHSVIDSSAPKITGAAVSGASSSSSESRVARAPSGQTVVDLFALLTLVQRIVAVEFKSNTTPGSEDHLKKQVPQLCSTLTRRLLLPIAPLQ